MKKIKHKFYYQLHKFKIKLNYVINFKKIINLKKGCKKRNMDISNTTKDDIIKTAIVCDKVNKTFNNKSWNEISRKIHEKNNNNTNSGEVD